ncbi:MAG: hypothetical protein JO154_15875 [Chitinophaga sp.]|uniref:hypothetical protein n=1 Tax=Chitinophaga sp. TaxID=1869181 RepID=UPI0025C4009C|nr:hypothetical protein [Chitinophaga sp.]MBV8254082.1 hypothetical protein [Chitinophaga sp.]
MSLLLNVPEADKVQALAAGAVYNTDANVWILPDTAYGRLKEVENWILPENAYLILTETLLIARGKTVCPHCGHTNQVIAIGAEQFFEKDINERDEHVWLEQDFFILFHQITTMSDNLRHLLEEGYPQFRPVKSDMASQVYWFNHCEQCQHPITDQRLMDEPCSTFHPTDAEEAGLITLKQVRLKFAPLMDAGYEPHPHQKLIGEYATRI